MADTPTQDGRIGRLATPLGKDALLLTRFDGSEGMGELFEFRVEALGLKPDIDLDPAIGLNCSVRLNTPDGVNRDFSGVLTEARWVGQRGDFFVYNLTLRPWLWLLSLSADCRIFSNMKPIDIIKQVFEEREFLDVIDLTSGEYPTLEYTVQYRETDLNFVMRLMEKYGVYFYFTFLPGDGSSPSSHLLTLADSTVHVPLPAPTEVPYAPMAAQSGIVRQQFVDWTKNRSIVTGVFSLTDYDYQRSKADLKTEEKFGYPFAHSDLETFNYPGGYNDLKTGAGLAQVIRDAARSRNVRFTASGYAPSLTPGFTIKRTSAQGDDPQDGEYIIVRASHSYGLQDYASSGERTPADYYGSYELQDKSVPFRMPLQTRRPVIVGTQSAVVVGDKNEEIDVDDQGRIMLQFPWDRKKTTSRRVRGAQVWAGMVHGFWFVPRIGDEVVVAYEDGDPDRPIVVASAYNDVNIPSIPLPSGKNRSGILTRSTKNAGYTHYNMLLFDDSYGAEKVKLRAERDLMFKALRNEQRDINGSQTENIGGDETITVGSPEAGGKFTLECAQSVELSVTHGTSDIKMEKDQIKITVPDTEIVLKPDSIELSIGGSMIKMDSMSIKISAVNIKIDGGTVVEVVGGVVKVNG